MKNKETVPIWPGWETVDLIGHGSYGSVYEIQRTIGKTVEKSALKVITVPKESSEIKALSMQGYDRESITERFQGLKESIEDEYSMMAKLKGCANVVYCDDIRTIQHDDGMGWDIYIRMELLTSLLEHRKVSLEEQEIVRLGKEMCDALVMCQKHNIVHRDIKPQNIFVSNDGTFKLGDFGIAKAVEHTTSGTTTGTYDYMAPEVERHRPYNRTVDIYSLGMVLYWYLNEKRLPFLPLPPAKIIWKDETLAKERRLQGEALPAPAHGCQELKRIVLKACAFDPEDRYQSAEEMLRDLNALSGETVELPYIPVSAAQEEPENGKGTEVVFLNRETAKGDRTQGAFDTSPGTEKGNSDTDGGVTVGAFFKKGRWGIAALVVVVALLTVFIAKTRIKLWPEPTPERSKVVDLEPTVEPTVEPEPVWSLPVYTWAADNSSVTAQRINQTNTDEIETETALTSSKITRVATCTTYGETSYSAVFVNPAFQPQNNAVENISPLGHQWSAWENIEGASCTQSGTEQRVCLNDQSHTETREIPALGHEWNVATCTLPQTCRVCGETEGEALGHNWVVVDESGSTVCLLCGEQGKTSIEDAANPTLTLIPYRGLLTQFKKLPFAGAAASSELNSVETGYFPANLAMDGDLTTSWQEGVTGTGEGESLTLYFDGEQEIAALELYPGQMQSEYTYQVNSRPKTVCISFSDNSSCLYTLEDHFGRVVLALSKPVRSSYVSLTIVEAYTAEWQDTAISEVIAYGKDKPLSLSSFSGSIDSFNRVSFSTATASSVYSEGNGFTYYPTNVIQDDISWPWVENAAGEGIGEYLLLYFDQEETIDLLGLHLGFASVYDKNNRPRTLRFDFSDGSSAQFEFMDINQIQYVLLNQQVKTNYVKLTIVDAYRSYVDDDTCITEVRAYRTS